MTAARPRYRENELLLAEDLRTEQAFRMTLRRRHDIAQHGWGIVSGLRLEARPLEFVVHPGQAVDGYGRSLLVPAPWRIAWNRDLGLGGPAGDLFDQIGAGKRDKLGVWLRYGELRDPTCRPGSAADRWIEEPVLELLSQPAAPTPRRPPGVSVAALAFGPQDVPAGEPVPAWPVYLGELVRVQADEGPIYRANGRRRPYAGLVAEQVVDPTGTVRMQVGAERPGDARRLAVTVDGTPAAADRLVVDAAGDTTLTGSVGLRASRPTGSRRGDLRLERGTADRTGLALGEVPAPATAAPWRVYHAAVTEEQAPPDAPPDRQLRFEIAAPAGAADPAGLRFVVACGAAPAPGQPPPAGLTVRADCTVVAPKLVVTGRLIEAAEGVALRNRLLAGTLTLDSPEATGAAARAARAAADLDVALELPQAPASPGATCRYEVRNAGTVGVTDVAVLAGATVLDASGSGIPATTTVAVGIRLNPGETTTGLAATIPNAPGQTLYVAVTAVGLGPVADPVFTAADGRVQVAP